MNPPPPYRIGHGFDVHAFCPGDHLVLGGVRIPFDKAFKAHSDGDVLIHALCDAILGAAALGDIGRHFPDTDPRFSGIDSRMLLRQVVEKVREKGLAVGNVDATIVAQAPKLMPYLPAMRANLAVDLAVDEDRVNLKATTTEKLGYPGRGEGVAAHAVVLLFES
ncbi:MAG TPA: 2-C-methyl-D-erythritol 2,4-cyclodiphosphate synthase [Gammaproteobacteria bacterium]|nr:2-C-methyl-D-erythritol 2,4-cyclodiphosphate synthase [Gammaproteobacteria bacterium]